MNAEKTKMRAYLTVVKKTLEGKCRISGGSSSERGIALVMVLIISTIFLGIMALLIFMLTSGTQISGLQKRYKTALEAGLGGSVFAYQLIGVRGDPGLTSLTYSITATNACLTDKLTKATSNWGVACINTQPITPGNTATYDLQVDLGTIPTYTVYGKIVDTVEGNSGGDFGLTKGGVVASNSGEVQVVSMPYLYTIEIDSENAANPLERAKLSVLYQY